MKVVNNSAASKTGELLRQGDRNGLMQPRGKKGKRCKQALPRDRFRGIILAVLLY